MTDQEMIDEIMDCFDFAKVEKVMGLMKWRWAENPLPPTEPELRKMARGLLISSMKDKAECRCGGFSVRVSRGDCGGVYALELSFELTAWSADRFDDDDTKEDS